jgi:hypothetical protein
MADSRVERNMMEAVKASRVDRDSIRRRGGILRRRLVGVVISSREDIRHHRSTLRSIEESKEKGSSDRY